MGSAVEQLEYDITEYVNAEVAQEYDESIEAASERLAQAFDRLDTAVKSRLLAEPVGVPHAFVEEQEALLAIWQDQCALLEREYETLRLENEQIAEELAQTKREFNDLREITQVVAGRLDGTIHNIDKLLDA